MKQMTSASDMVSLSAAARQKLNKWLKEKEYGSEIDGEFIPYPQLTIGVMLEFLIDNADRRTRKYFPPMHGDQYDDPWITDDFADELFKEMKEILEQKN